MFNMENQSRLNAYIDRELYKQVKIYAATNNTTITKVIENAIKEYIEKK